MCNMHTYLLLTETSEAGRKRGNFRARNDRILIKLLFRNRTVSQQLISVEKVIFKTFFKSCKKLTISSVFLKKND